MFSVYPTLTPFTQLVNMYIYLIPILHDMSQNTDLGKMLGCHIIWQVVQGCAIPTLST